MKATKPRSSTFLALPTTAAPASRQTAPVLLADSEGETDSNSSSSESVDELASGPSGECRFLLSLPRGTPQTVVSDSEDVPVPLPVVSSSKHLDYVSPGPSSSPVRRKRTREEEVLEREVSPEAAWLPARGPSPDRQEGPSSRKRARHGPTQGPQDREAPPKTRPAPRMIGAKASQAPVSAKGKGKALVEPESSPAAFPVVEPPADVSQVRDPRSKSLGTAEVAMKGTKPSVVLDSALNEFVRRVRQANPASKIGKDQLLEAVDPASLVRLFLLPFVLFCSANPVVASSSRIMAVPPVAAGSAWSVTSRSGGQSV